MKLIDILVEELPKRGGWPDDSDEMCQSQFDCEIYTNSKLLHDFYVGERAEDNGTDNVVTREQYEAALAAKNDGWIEWGGGKHPPVSTNAVVDVKLRCGSVIVRQPAGAMNWQINAQCYHGDIIAYRLHQQTKSEQVRAAAWNAYAGITMADDEADLNECIGQNAAPVWNGDGVIPPVGCMCERSWCGDEWQPCKILFASNQLVVVKLKESGREDAYNIGDVILRHIRPEAELKRDEAVKTIMLTGWCQSFAEEIYDLVAAGKVPGMKLED